MDFDDLVMKKKIDHSDKDLHDEGLGVLIEVVQKSNVLQELGLCGNRLTLADGEMAEAIARSPALRVLILGRNEISDEGAKRLADAIKANETLQEIYLHNNEIGDEGAKLFADALAVNKSLRRMHLGRNEIGDEGAKSLAASLETNRTLQKVIFAGNNITDEGALKLADALCKNCTINELDLGSDTISSKVRKMTKVILSNKCRTFRMHIGKMFASKDEENAVLKQVLAAKDRELECKEEEIASLKAEHSASLNLSKKSIEAPLEQLKMIRDTVDLTGVDPEPPSKRPRMENAVKSNLAVLHEQNQKMVRIKQEKNAAETALKGAREEKAAVEADRDEVRDDLEDANELVQQEALATDVWMRRFDELATMVAGQVDGAVISEIRNRSLASGS